MKNFLYTLLYFFSDKLCFTKKWLDTHHYNNEFHVYKGMGHSISGVEVQELVSFIKKKINS
ncbi:hypothetical protein [Chryseobacterium sp. MYb328]|uniref:hypothetical protein n=1 Tax=Chryseobacterium sp. MYb328 TaxID=2745231 RepID=UPI00309FD588